MAQDLNRLARRLTGRRPAKMVPYPHPSPTWSRRILNHTRDWWYPAQADHPQLWSALLKLKCAKWTWVSCMKLGILGCIASKVLLMSLELSRHTATMARVWQLRMMIQECLRYGVTSTTSSVWGMRATCFIRKLAEGQEGDTTTATATCDDPGNKMDYLSTTSGFHPMYCRYMQEQGYKVTVCETGAVSVA